MSAHITKMKAQLEARKTRLEVITRISENAVKPSSYMSYEENEYERGFERGERSMAREILSLLSAPAFTEAYQPGNPEAEMTEKAELMVQLKTLQAYIARIRKHVQPYKLRGFSGYYYESNGEIGFDRGEAAFAVRVRSILSN